MRENREIMRSENGFLSQLNGGVRNRSMDLGR